MRDLGVVRKSHSVPDKGQEAKMNELEEIQSRTCFNQTFFSPLGLARSFFLDALNFERQAVVGERPLVIQAGQEGESGSARHPPISALVQPPKRHTWRERATHRLSPSLLVLVNCLVFAFFLSFVSPPASFPLSLIFTFWVLLHRKSLL